MAVVQSLHVLTDILLSGASPLPHLNRFIPEKSGRQPFHNDDLRHPRPFTVRLRLLIFSGLITRHRLLIALKLNHHITLPCRPAFHRFTAPAPGQEPSAKLCERRRRALGVLRVLLRIGHIHMGNPVGLHRDILLLSFCGIP